MAEVGLLPFARIALLVSKADFRATEAFSASTNSRSGSCWPFREAEVRLGEHRELRQTLGLCATTRPTIAQVGETVRRLRGSSFI
jgi:hypothetical protein